MLAALRDPRTPRRASEIADIICGVGTNAKQRQVVYTTLGKLAKTERIDRVKYGVYALRAEPQNPIRIAARHPNRSASNVVPDDHEDWPLIDAIQAGDRDAEQAMLIKHERLLHMICHRYRSGPVDHDDLMQEARLGLLKGLIRAKRGHGANPITYAVCWVRQSVQRYFESAMSDVRLPTHVIQKKKHRRIIDNGMRLFHQVSMEQPLSGSTEDDRVVADTLASSSAAPDDDEVIGNARIELLRSDLKRLVGQLREREAEVIRLRFLVDEPETLEQIGIRFNVSRERIRQIERDAVERLRTMRRREEMMKIGLPPAEDAAAVRAEKIVPDRGDVVIGIHGRRRRAQRNVPRPATRRSTAV